MQLTESDIKYIKNNLILVLNIAGSEMKNQRSGSKHSSPQWGVFMETDREETGGGGERGEDEDGDSPAAEQLVSRRAASPNIHLVSGGAPQ